MFFKLVSRNSRRSRKENGLFFSSLLISIIAFYIILSLSQQDVMRFLEEMESDAVSRLLAMIPVFYGMTLVILFFLIYFASKFQLERRKHEFGMYLMLGMGRRRLFAMLLAEDFRSSIGALLIGLPGAVLLSELISLVTAKVVGLGIVGHQFSISLSALLWTSAGFLIIKLAAFLILSGKISRQEIGSLLVNTPDVIKKQKPSAFYGLALIMGLACLIAAYYLAISGISWQGIVNMAVTLILGLIGTLLLFFGMRFCINMIIQSGKGDRKLHVFNFRQLQENVIHQSGTMAVSSLLVLAALCCFGAGVSIAAFYGRSEHHVLDYTFVCDEFESSGEDMEKIKDTLTACHLETSFSKLFEIKVGNIRTRDDYENIFVMDGVMKDLSALPESEERDILLNNLSYADNPHLISVSGYNELLESAGLPTLELEDNEAAVYIDDTFTTEARSRMLNSILADRPEAQLDDAEIYLTGEVQSTSLVTDRSITLAFALILPDHVFEHYTQNQFSIYVNGILSGSLTKNGSLMNIIYEMNQVLDKTRLNYESHLQNMGRQLFYMVAASYITIYLAVIFLIIANTVIGVQFLMNQQKTNRRYKTLIRLGATYEVLCQSAEKQIHWSFGMPVIVALISSFFGVRALFSGILSSRMAAGILQLMLIAGAMILMLCVIEYLYMQAVKRSSNRYLMTLMVPGREE